MEEKVNELVLFICQFFPFLNFPLSGSWVEKVSLSLFFSKIQDIISGGVKISLNQQGFKNQIDSLRKWVKIKMHYDLREAELGHVNKMEEAWTT